MDRLFGPRRTADLGGRQVSSAMFRTPRGTLPSSPSRDVSAAGSTARRRAKTLLSSIRGMQTRRADPSGQWSKIVFLTASSESAGFALQLGQPLLTLLFFIACSTARFWRRARRPGTRSESSVWLVNRALRWSQRASYHMDYCCHY